MLIDLEGRVHNYELVYSKALFPVFEAVINSIHAIQEARDGGMLPANGGRITVRLEREATPRLASDTGEPLGLAAVQDVVVEDDGIGFTKANFDAFNTSDTTKKRKVGGRGIGRFSWLKAFARAEVRSVFVDDQGHALVRDFRFVLPQGVEDDAVSAAAKDQLRLTSVRLVSARPRYADEIPKRADIIAHRIIEHCLDYFVVGEIPRIVVEDPGNDSIDLNELYASAVRGSSSVEPFEISGKPLQATHVMVAARGGLGHRLHFCANRRVVRSEPLDRHLVDLDDPVQQPSAALGTRGYFYAGYVSGTYLDETATPDRTDFFIARQGDLLGDDEVRWPDLVDGCVQRVREYLAPYIGPLRDEKEKYIHEYVQHERPIYRPLLRHRPQVIDAIPRNLSKERLDIELYKHQQAYESDLRAEGEKVIATTDALDGTALEEYTKALEAFLRQWNEVGISRLAEYVTHRRATLKLLEKTLSMGTDGKYALESAVHKVIFPMRITSDDVPADQMNLWIIDEKLAYHRYLASDLQLRNLEVLAVEGKQRPDLVVFNRPVAFVDRSIGEGQDSITIIEFKRPVRDDYDDEHNPITQVYDYVERIRGGIANDRGGRPFTVPETVRFYVYIVCDLTKTLRTQARAANLTLMPDGQGFFGWNSEYRCYIEIMSFNKLVNDAQLRNRILFDKLENRC